MLPDSPEILPIFLSEFLLIIFLCCYLFLHFFFLAFGILFEFHWFVWLIIWIWFSQPLQMLTYPITIHFKKGSLHHFCLNKGILKESLHRTLKTICIIYILKDSFGFFKSFEFFWIKQRFLEIPFGAPQGFVCYPLKFPASNEVLRIYLEIILNVIICCRWKFWRSLLLFIWIKRINPAGKGHRTERWSGNT